jgi:hypothetical protein
MAGVIAVTKFLSDCPNDTSCHVSFVLIHFVFPSCAGASFIIGPWDVA